MKEKKKVVAMYANVFETVVGQGIPYMEFASQFGEVLLVHTGMDLKKVIDTADILFLPGGLDVLATSWGFLPSFRDSKANPQYEALDEHLLAPWIKTGKPIIGICRGLQVLNTRMGGTLHQHIENHVQPEKFGRDGTPEEMFTDLQYEVGLDKYKKPIIEDFRIHKINSFHHQGIRRVAEGFDVLGWGLAYGSCTKAKDCFVRYRYTRTKDNQIKKSEHPYFSIPEIIKHKTLPFIAFQYHPEETMDELAITLINETLNTYYAEETTEEGIRQTLGEPAKA